jgi:hypothetical protein
MQAASGPMIFASGTGNTTGGRVLHVQAEGQPESVQIREPEPVNIPTALAENESVVKDKSRDGGRKAIALEWLFRLVPRKQPLTDP